MLLIQKIFGIHPGANDAKHDLDEASLLQEVQQLELPKENSDAIGR